MTPRPRWMKTAAWLLTFCFIAEFAAPGLSYALTSGPTQPEFSSFEPVATTGMVNEFSGGFTYNLPVVQIPGANGGGYALSLSYHSNHTAAEDASWVGYGWSLNPGAINRGKKGFPDDAHSADVKYYNKMPKNETYAAGWSVSGQAFSFNYIPVDLSMDAMVRYNNNTGFSTVQGYGVSVAGAANFGYRIEDGYGKFSLTLSPLNLFVKLLLKTTDFKEIAKDLVGKEQETGKKVTGKDITDKLKDNINFNGNLTKVAGRVSSYLNAQTGIHSMPLNAPKYSGAYYTLNFRNHSSAAPGSPGQIGGVKGIFARYTWQQPDAIQTKQAFGYMYSGEAYKYDTRDDAVFDYMTEKSGDFTRKDRYLGIPFNSADNFAVSGEGLSGAFRLHNRRPGIMHPNREKSTLWNISVTPSIGPGGSGETGIGTHIGIGGEQKVGYQRVNVNEWLGPLTGTLNYSSDYDSSGYFYDGEPYFFRFSGDKGGTAVFDGDDEPLSTDIALITGTVPLPDTTKFHLLMNEDVRPGRSSLICYNTNAEMLDTIGGVNYRAFTRDSMNLFGHVDRTDPVLLKQIGEIAIVNKSGNSFQYGLPVYSRNERSMRFVMSDGGVIDNSYLFVGRHESSHSNVSGQSSATPYASSYLLTAITTPSYLDRTGDGPTDDDFGGYTRFDYRRTAGTYDKSGDDTDDEWYKWRSPYTGYHYDPGKLITGNDNAGTVSSGEKELYYLQRVETRSHIAYFICNKSADTISRTGLSDLILSGSGDERFDAYEAYRDPAKDAIDEEKQAAAGEGLEAYDGNWTSDLSGRVFDGHTQVAMNESKQSVQTPNKNEYLERIVVYAKNANGDPEKLLKTVHFEYDYSLMYSHPKDYNAYFIHRDTVHSYTGADSIITNDTIYFGASRLNSAVNYSKDGVHPNHASTHVTQYKHGKLTLKRVWMEYEGVVNARISPYDFEYSYKCDDDTHFAPEVKSRYPDIVSAMNEFSDSCGTNASVNENPPYHISAYDRWGFYDPSMPARRRIHKPYVPQNPSSHSDPAVWHLKTIRLPSGGEIHVQYERNRYAHVQDQPAMAMVKLSDIEADEPTFGKNTYRCYLDVESELGVTDTSEMRKMASKIHQELGPNSGERVFFRFLYQLKDCSISSTAKSFPSLGCDYISGYSNIVKTGVSDHEGKYRLWVELRSDVTPVEVAEEFSKTNRARNYSCDSQIELDDPDHFSEDFWRSLLALLPLEPALELAATELFNSYTAEPIYEYSYLRIPMTRAKLGGGVRVKRLLMYDDGLESGDAVLYGTEYLYENEDGSCSGVATNEPAEGREENSVVRYLKKRDDRNFLEYLAAGKDLTQGEGPLGETLLPAPTVNYARVVTKSIHSGKTSTGFTVTEFNTVRDFPMKAKHTSLSLKTSIADAVLEVVLQSSMSRYWASQGYAFELNSMHGQQKRIAKYGGEYDPDDASKSYLVESVEFEYFEPGEKIPMFNGPSEAITFESPGKEVELVTEAKEVTDRTDFLKSEIDAGVSFPGTLLVPNFYFTMTMPMYEFDEAIVKTYVTNKIVHYPVFQKSITTIKEGIRHKQTFAAFDPATGEPVITLNADAFDGLNLPQSADHKGTYASYNFPAWQQYPQLGQAAYNYRLRGFGATYNQGSKILAVTSGGDRIGVGDKIRLRAGAGLHALYDVTAVGAGGTSISLQLVSHSFDLASGTVDWEIIRSGRRNQLDISAGSLTTYGRDSADVVGTSDLTQLTSGVVSASATVFSDYWPYDTGLYGEVFPGSSNTPTDYETGVRGRYRPSRSYVYRRDVQSGVTASTDRNYNDAGVMSGFSFFDWANIGNNGSNWVGLTEVTKVSPHGEVLEEVDVLGIPSAARFAHSNQVPRMVAANAEFGSLVFRSFEEGDGNSAGTAHSGDDSFELTSAGYVTIDSLEGSSRLRTSGALMQVWTRGGPVPSISARIDGNSVSLQKIAQSGEWTLYEGSVAANLLSASGTLDVEVIRATAGTYIDDLRVQPLDAQASCYVYDPANLRLITQFDDQHFGLYYQYTAEGKLARRLIETVDGIKTVQESQYHTPLTDRSSYGLGGAQISSLVLSSTYENISPKYLPMPPMRDASPGSLPINRDKDGSFDILDLNLKGSCGDVNILNIDTLQFGKEENK